MRLTCPNCNAQYEVDERVIPRNGRDVQCSACGHTWYQYPLEVALQMRAADLDDDDEDDDTGGRPAPAPVDGTGRTTAPRIDKTVLDVLREEAQRELEERKRAQATLETQTEMGLARRPQSSKAAPSRVYGEDAPAPERPAPLPEPAEDPAAEGRRAPRRALLPDIEELTSTLEPDSEPRASDPDDDEPPRQGGGFRRGLSTALLIALALVMPYLLAPLLVSWVPQLDAPLRAYVQAVDGLRATVGALMRGLFAG